MLAKFNHLLKYLAARKNIAILVVLLGLLVNLVLTLVLTEQDMFHKIYEIDLKYLIFAIFLTIVPWFTNSLRVFLWVRFLKYKFPYFNIFKIILSQELGAALSPTAIGGGYVKTAMLINKGVKSGQAVSLMTLGSVEDGLFFLSSLPLAAFITLYSKQYLFNNFEFATKLPTILIVAIAVAVVIILVRRQRDRIMTLSFIKKIVNTLKKMWQDFIAVYVLIGKHGKARFCLTIFLAAVQWTCRYSVLTALLMSLHIPVHPVQIFLLQWITFTLMTFIPTPGAALGAEASFALVYSPIVPIEYTGMIIAAWRFLTFYFLIGLSTVILGVLNLITLVRKKRKSCVKKRIRRLQDFTLVSGN